MRSRNVWQLISKLVTTRRVIQHEYLKLLNEHDFSFQAGDKEPFGLQRKVLDAVNRQFFGTERLKTNKQQVSVWVAKVRENNYQPTACEQDYSQSSKNYQKFGRADQQRVREIVRNQKLTCNDVTTIFSDIKQEDVTISRESVRRFMKMRFDDEPSHVAAVPKPNRIGGLTAHHSRARLKEARFWKRKSRAVINGIWFADESKMMFTVKKNKQIDIQWVFRGDASEANWYDAPRWPGQINLFIAISIRGVEMFELYDKNMGIAEYKQKLPVLGALISTRPDFTFYMHDNAWRGVHPVAELDEHIGRGKWTQYCGKPCTTNSKTMRTPIRKIPVKVPKKRCTCVFPRGPIHASFNPKMNLAEEAFAELGRIIHKNQQADEIAGRKWIKRGPGKKALWKRQIRKAIKQLNKNPLFFHNQYDTFKKRCDAYIESRGKRLKTSKW